MKGVPLQKLFLDQVTPFFVGFPRLFKFYFSIIIFNKLIFGSWSQLAYLW